MAKAEILQQWLDKAKVCFAGIRGREDALTWCRWERKGVSYLARNYPAAFKHGFSEKDIEHAMSVPLVDRLIPLPWKKSLSMSEMCFFYKEVVLKRKFPNNSILFDDPSSIQ